MKANLLLFGILVLAIPTMIFAEPPDAGKFGGLKNTVILVIRHAEKSDDGYELSADGEERAKAYINYFKDFTIDGKPLKLDYLFAAADSKESHRPRLTIEPTSKALGLALDTRFRSKNVQGLADEIKSEPHGKGILIVWHHEEIPALLRALGADPDHVIPNAKWPGHVFDWLIQLRYDQNGQLIEVKRINEKLMPGDSK
jgi:broad specificity phosphatase PhoE